ncbi:hemerythrin domain-containing protein [Kitasatospora sp. NPDC059673]|uniref:hemerythrin domain-containing protein n=1 Tax=Kitasatospora sp. NPDC059673 TaxID=3346901 RepID=UPI0036C5F9FE
MTVERELDLLEQLTTDHEVLRVRFSELAGLPLGDPQRDRLAFLTADTLVRHLAAEDEYLYPIARDGRPPHDDAVAHGLQTHAALYGLVRELQATAPGSAEFDRLLARLIEQATGHFGLEEAQLFPTVRTHAAPPRLQALGEQARETERTTSPHPRPAGPRDTLPPDDLVAPELTWHERMHRLFRFGDTREN